MQEPDGDERDERAGTWFALDLVFEFQVRLVENASMLFERQKVIPLSDDASTVASDAALHVALQFGSAAKAIVHCIGAQRSATLAVLECTEWRATPCTNTRSGSEGRRCNVLTGSTLTFDLSGPPKAGPLEGRVRPHCLSGAGPPCRAKPARERQAFPW